MTGVLLGMTIDGEYAPSPAQWVREQVETIEATGTTRSVHIQNRPVVMLTMRGATSGSVRKVPVMRVEHDGEYVAVASKGGAPEHPQWFHNLLAHPDIEIQDDREAWPARVRLIGGEERAQWWERAVAAYPSYADYQAKTEREIPLFLIERR